MTAVMIARLRSTQLRLLWWNFRQSTMNRKKISMAKVVVTTVSTRATKGVRLDVEAPCKL